MLCFVFIPVYYKYNCTTTTELLEKRYRNPHIRALISVLFLLGNIFIFLPAILYGGSLFMQNMFGIGVNLYIIAAIFAIIGSAYAIFGGLRAVAISDTFSGVLLLGLALFVTFIALKAINFDFNTHREPDIGYSLLNSIYRYVIYSDVLLVNKPNHHATRYGLTNSERSPKRYPRRRGYKIAHCPDIGDATYGRIVGDLLPPFLSGAFAAAIAAAVLTTFNSILNASAALWVCDIHETYFNDKPNVMIPIFNNPESSLINTVQTLYGLLSMPILSAFIVGLLFKNVNPYAMITAVVFGVALYAVFVFAWPKLPGGGYIHMMAITLLSSVSMALLLNRLVFGQKAQWDAHTVFGKAKLPDNP